MLVTASKMTLVAHPHPAVRWSPSGGRRQAQAQVTLAHLHPRSIAHSPQEDVNVIALSVLDNPKERFPYKARRVAPCHPKCHGEWVLRPTCPSYSTTTTTTMTTATEHSTTTPTHMGNPIFLLVAFNQMWRFWVTFRQFDYQPVLWFATATFKAYPAAAAEAVTRNRNACASIARNRLLPVRALCIVQTLSCDNQRNLRFDLDTFECYVNIDAKKCIVNQMVSSCEFMYSPELDSLILILDWYMMLSSNPRIQHFTGLVSSSSSFALLNCKPGSFLLTVFSLLGHQISLERIVLLSTNIGWRTSRRMLERLKRLLTLVQHGGSDTTNHRPSTRVISAMATQLGSLVSILQYKSLPEASCVQVSA